MNEKPFGLHKQKCFDTKKEAIAYAKKLFEKIEKENSEYVIIRSITTDVIRFYVEIPSDDYDIDYSWNGRIEITDLSIN